MRALLLVLFCLGTAQAQVIETRSMEEVLTHVDKDTLLIFDLDNTIIMPAQMLGGEEWYDYLVEKYVGQMVAQGVKEDKATSAAIDRALAEWNVVQRMTATVPVEKRGPALIAEAQARGAKTLALTARGAELSDRTHEMLVGVGIHFAKAPFETRILDLKTEAPARHENGVVFAGPLNNKGKVLVEFLKATEKAPKKIVFVDNKKKHVDNVEKQLGLSSIKYIGCRHGASDAKIAAFDPKVADVQFIQHFHSGKILDNSSAKKLAKTRAE